MDANNKQVHVDSIDEEIVARVAGIDVAKDSGMVCTRVPHQSQPGKRTTTVWSVSARTNSIIELADRLAEERIERVVLEATSDYWRPFYYLLASAGPGGVGGQRPRREERPGPAQNRQARRRLACQTQRTWHAAGFVHPADRDSPAAGLHPAAGRPDRRTVPPYPAAGEATRGCPDQTVLGGHQHDGGLRPGDDRGTDRRHARRPSATRSCQPRRRGRTGVSGRGRPSRRNHRSRASRRPGDHRRGRTVHGDLPTAAHLVSWAKLSPRANQSGAKTRSGKTGKGNPYLKSVLGEAAASAGRIGKLKALVAVARSILVIVWHLLADPTRRYRDLGPEFFDNRIRPERRKINHVRQLEALGYTVTLTPQPDYQPRRQFIFRSGNRELRCV